MPSKKEITPFVFLSEQTEPTPLRETLVKKNAKKVLEYDETKKGENIPFFPTSFAAVEEIAQELVKGATVILNVASLPELDATRTLDFLCGVIYSYRGRIKQINSFDFELSIFSE